MANKTEKDVWIEMSIREISTQAHFAIISYKNIDPKAKANTDVVFSSIHSFLSHCANISKMLRPLDENKRQKTQIQDTLGIKDSIIHNRNFRNHLEHYDERLEKWIREKGVNTKIGTYNIGPKSKFPNMILISHYDPSNNTFTFVDQDCNLSILYDEVVKIKNIADKWVEKLH